MSPEMRQPDQEERLARLALYLGLNTNTGAFHRVMRHTGSAVAAFEGVDLTVLGVNLPTLLSNGFFEEAYARFREAESKGLDILIWGDEHFPLRLDEIPDPPPALWVKGKIEAGDQFSVGLVGSRTASFHGLASARRFAGEGAAKGLTIVSGLAKGVDAQAHWGALEAGGRTLAVLGSGLDWKYPKENAKLYEHIPASGALISEFPPDLKPIPANFPRRNRVIAGLSLAVVVVEAGERSGALITARQALEINREVMALPGPAGIDGARGGNKLIKDGAALVENMDEVIAEIRPRLLEGLNPIQPAGRPIAAPPLNHEEIPAPLAEAASAKRGQAGAKAPSSIRPQLKDIGPPPEPDSPEGIVLKILASGPKDAESLVQLSGLTVSDISLTLLTLELQGQLVRLESGLYQTAK